MQRSSFKQKLTTPLKRTALKTKTPLKRSTIKSKPLKGKKASKSGKKVKTQAQLKKELDTIFSIYIRQKFSDSDGNNTCYTCGKAGTIKTMQNGHFVSRQYLATRWSENNCRIQCSGCNLFGNGKPLDFEERLKKDLGSEYVEKMKASRHISLKLDRHWYIAEIEKYKLLIT